MRRTALLPLLLAILLLGACDAATGLGGRSVDGDWVARIDGEEVWIRLRDDRGRISGSGEWGFDTVYVTGDRNGSDVYLSFEFSRFNPVDFEARIVGDRLEGWLSGSGYSGLTATFRRD